MSKFQNKDNKVILILFVFVFETSVFIVCNNKSNSIICIPWINEQRHPAKKFSRTSQLPAFLNEFLFYSAFETNLSQKDETCQK